MSPNGSAVRFRRYLLTASFYTYFDIAAGDGTTNVAFGEGEKELYVTVVKDQRTRRQKAAS
jgi:hypothetical protein